MGFSRFYNSAIKLYLSSHLLVLHLSTHFFSVSKHDCPYKEYHCSQPLRTEKRTTCQSQPSETSTETHRFNPMRSGERTRTCPSRSCCRSCKSEACARKLFRHHEI